MITNITERMEIGYKIKKIREFRNFSQEYMAELLGITQGSYSKIEKGQTKLDIDRFQLIAGVLNVEPVFLLNFDEGKVFERCNRCVGSPHKPENICSISAKCNPKKMGGQADEQS